MKVKSLDLLRLRNSEFIQFIRQTIEIIVENDPALLKVETLFNDLSNQLNVLESLHKKTRANALTTTIEALDERRDYALIGLSLIVEGHLYASKEDLKEAAKLLNASLSNYGNTPREITRLNYNAETATIISLLNEWNNSTELTAALKTLSITDFVLELNDANTAFGNAYKDRLQEYAAANPETLKETRAATLPKYVALKELLQAHQIVENTTERTAVINQLNALIDQYNNLLTTRNIKPETNEELSDEEE